MFLATKDDVEGTRNRAILAFLTDTGCRSGGLRGLTLDRLDIQAGRALVLEKGERARFVPFKDLTAALLTQWLAVRPTKTDVVFCSLGSRYIGQPLTASGLHQMLERLALKAGVTGRFNAHSFRHGFAREFLLKGGDTGLLSRLMGHSSVDVTIQSYGVFEFNELLKAHSQFSPISTLEEVIRNAKNQ